MEEGTCVSSSILRALPVRNATRHIDVRALQTHSYVLRKSLESRIEAFAIKAGFIN